LTNFLFPKKKLLRRFQVYLPEANSSFGLNALTFVPKKENPEGGSFWIGSSVDGSVYIYDLPLITNTSSLKVNFTGSFKLISDINDLRSLYYHKETDKVYGILDHWLISMNTKMSSLPSAISLLGFPDPTGVAVVGSGSGMQLYISCGSCSDIWKFPFPDASGISSGKCYPKIENRKDASSSKLL